MDAEEKTSPLPVNLRFIAAQSAEARSVGKDSADKESDDIGNESLHKEAAKKEHRRAQRFKDHFERIMIMAMWFLAFCCALTFAVFIAHLIFPIEWCWLSKETLSSIQNFMFGSFGGAVIASVSQHLHKRMD